MTRGPCPLFTQTRIGFPFTSRAVTQDGIHSSSFVSITSLKTDSLGSGEIGFGSRQQGQDLRERKTEDSPLSATPVPSHPFSL
eukprot:15219872-Heterocapsa_arctica.AAC.1